MITKHDAERIAAGIHGFRPDWPVQQLMTLAHELQHWPVLDLFVGLAHVAADPASKSPYRVKEQGPWRTIGTTDPEGEKARERADREYRQRLASIEERRRAAAVCHLCDEHGYLSNGRVCTHTEEAGRAHRGAALARAHIRPTITPESRIAEDA